MAFSQGRYRYGFDALEVGALNSRWKHRVRQDQTFGSFDAFLRWASESGYTNRAYLLKRDAALPYGPENCYWEEPKTGKEDRADTSSNMAPPKEHPCRRCPKKTCNEICVARAKWWDVQMEKLREALREE